MAHSFVLVLLRSCTVPEDQVQRTKIFSSELCLPPASTRRAGGGGRSRPVLLTPSMISSYLVYDLNSR